MTREATPPEIQPVWGDYFDGLRALRQRVRLTVEDTYRGRVLVIEPPEGKVRHWSAQHIRRLPDQAPGKTVLGLSLDDPTRVVLSVEAAETLLPIIGSSVRGRLAAPPLWPRALIVFMAGAVTLAALIFMVLPALAGSLARFMNPEAEVAMGREHYELTRRMFGGEAGMPLRECDDPAGRAALAILVARVSDGVDLPYDIKVQILDDSASPVLNAYAVAGGRITFFDSLIQTARTPEEVAAVFAHELGHVVYSDPVRHTLQSASSQAVLAVLVGDLSGGGVLTATFGNALVASYSRGAEMRADDFAVAQLSATGLPPSAMGSFFERARATWGEAEGLGAYFSSHPRLTSRIEASLGVGDPPIGQPALTPKDWAALQSICR